MPVNNLEESFVDGGPPTGATWFRILRRVAEIRRARTRQHSIQTSQCKANGQGAVPLFPASMELGRNECSDSMGHMCNYHDF